MELIGGFAGNTVPLYEMLERYQVNGRTPEQAVIALRSMIAASEKGMALDWAANKYSRRGHVLGEYGRRETRMGVEGTPHAKFLPKVRGRGDQLNPCYLVRTAQPEGPLLGIPHQNVADNS